MTNKTAKDLVKNENVMSLKDNELLEISGGGNGYGGPVTTIPDNGAAAATTASSNTRNQTFHFNFWRVRFW